MHVQKILIILVIKQLNIDIDIYHRLLNQCLPRLIPLSGKWIIVMYVKIQIRLDFWHVFQYHVYYPHNTSVINTNRIGSFCVFYVEP